MIDKFELITKNKINKLPKTAGVYCFFTGKNIIYIGKAINVKSRVKNHFQQPSYRDNLFIEKIDKIGFIETNSEIEALILEADLIKKNQPKFNVVWRDDKNYFYVTISENKQKVPYVYITHQPRREAKSKYIGPFVDGNALKKTLKLLRRVFPFYTSSTHPSRKCSWCHLDLCPGPRLFEARLARPSGEAANLLTEYRKNINKLILVLQGKRRNVLRQLKKEMELFSASQEFEKAAKTRNKIEALENIMSHANVIGHQMLNVKYQASAEEEWGKTKGMLKELLDINKDISKIECYDVSNIQGKQATGSMVVFVNGEPDKSQYKKFKIKMENEPNDIAMLNEVLKRRFLHTEWKYPEVILIDGGKAQLNIAIKAKSQNKKSKGIKVTSIAKGRQELFIAASPEGRASLASRREGIKYKVIPLKSLPQNIYNLIKHLDDQAHRFAITYHKKLRRKALGIDI